MMGDQLTLAAIADIEHLSADVAQTIARARTTAVRARTRAMTTAESRALDTPVETLLTELADTPLGAMARLARDENEVRTLAHTLHVNDAAVNQVIAAVSDPIVLSHAVSLLTEKALHTHIDPRSGASKRNLSAAKRAGTFFTPPRIALEMAALALEGVDGAEVTLEPASGTAALSVALMTAATQKNTPLENIFAWEMSPYLARLSKRVLEAAVERLNISTHIHVLTGDAIVRFAEDPIRPDLIVMNPPYGRIKYLASEATNAETKATDVQATVDAGRAWATSTQNRYASIAVKFGLRPRGLDYQRLFMAGAMRILNSTGRMVCISPSSWTSGPNSKDIREVLLRNQKVGQVFIYPEDSKLFPTVNQPTAIVVADQDIRHDRIDITLRGKQDQTDTTLSVNYSEVFNAVEGQLSIPLVSHDTRAAYAAVSQLPRLSAFDCIKNARGELDLTADKWMLSTRSDDVRLVRGDHLERYLLSDANGSSKPSHVSPEGMFALQKRAKWGDTQLPRIVGRQVAYMGKSRRLSFAEVPKAHVVANSCNYLVAANSDIHYALLGYLNSTPAEWWFRLHSANNHVSNREIATIPWPFLDKAVLEAIAASASVRADAIDGSAIAKRAEAMIDALTCFGLSLSTVSAKPVLAEILSAAEQQEVLSLLEWFRRHGVPAHIRARDTWLQHQLNTLSELDYEMIRHVPVGGNWQNIPASVPSKRLDQIRAMSANRGVVRTTYYGRLRPDQPSYTIATYYNRPGNGTNIHPHENRTLSHREAARLQSFPDTYGFIGGEGAVRTQIGNAVPPLLGRAVANRLLQSGIESGPVVDLFSGAGGLSLGFELAGMNVDVAVDHNDAALQTYAFNRPTESIADRGSGRTLLVGADLSDPAVREDVYAAIRQKLGGEPPRVLIGGPPCQGFSYAGFRDPLDPRSDLAVAFLDFVNALNPEAVVLENVEGLLTAQGGRVARELIATLNELGYPVEAPWVLAAEQYGVPQMRRRVFFVAEKGAPIAPPSPLFDRCKGRREDAAEVRTHKYPVTTAEAFLGLPLIVDRMSEPLPVERNGFARWAAGSIDTQAFLDTHAFPPATEG